MVGKGLKLFPMVGIGLIGTPQNGNTIKMYFWKPAGELRFSGKCLRKEFCEIYAISST